MLGCLSCITKMRFFTACPPSCTERDARCDSTCLLNSSQNALAQLGNCVNLPEQDTLEEVIADSINAGFTFFTPPIINIIDLNYVCVVSGTLRDTYRIVSVVVRYSCLGFLCPAGTLLSQYDVSCNSEGMWVDGLNQHFHRDIADADLATPNRTECSFCVAPNHPLLATIALPYDDTTHCVGMSVHVQYNSSWTQLQCWREVSLILYTGCFSILPYLMVFTYGFNLGQHLVT